MEAKKRKLEATEVGKIFSGGTWEVKKGGPPPTVEITYDTKTEYGKIFAKKIKPASKDEMLDSWKQAREERIPTPTFGAYEYNCKDEEKKGLYFWTFDCGEGFTLFKVSVSDSIIKKWVNMQTDIKYLDTLLKIFRVHKRGDAQGLFENKDRGEIKFIDLFNKETPLGGMQRYIETVETRINQLKSK